MSEQQDGTDSDTPSATSAKADNQALRASGKPMPHNYDGISEYDNPLPGWWSAIFLITFIHSVGYFWWYHLGGPGKSETEQYAANWSAYSEMRQKIEAAEQAKVDEPLLAARAKDPAAMERAKELFGLQCVSCHGPEGAGLVGPNLTDDHQIHGTTRKDIYVVIRDGVVEKGMIPWGTMLSHEQLLDLTGYVANLRGKNVAGKAPEGPTIPPWSEQ